MRRLAHILALAAVLALAGCGAEGAALQEQAGDVFPATASAPSPPPPTTTPGDCSGTLAASIVRIDSLEELAWTSHQVIIGTVIERQPSVWGHAHNPLDPSRRLIYTPYLVRVEQGLRGQPGDIVTVRQWGGTIGTCTQTKQTNTFEQGLAVGERVLLFLRASNPPGTSLTYSVNGGDQGRWTIEPDGTVSSSVGHLERYNRQSLATIVAQVLSSLASGPPATPWVREHLVPLESAPAWPSSAGP